MPADSRTLVAALDDALVDDTCKGWPSTRAPVRQQDVAACGLNVLRQDLHLPVAVLKQQVIDHNARWMRDFLAASGARLAPHGKTTMSPQLFQRQLDDGAWAITVATAWQLQVCRRFGFPRVFLANQLVDRQALAVAMDELARDAGFELYSLVDSLAGVHLVADAARRAGLARPVRLLVEVGFDGGRTGCRTAAQALEVARAVATEPALALCGVEGFEGLIHSDDAVEDARRVRAFLASLVEVARACAAARLFSPGPVLLSAGGSAYYDLVTEALGKSGVEVAQVVLRCGCYLTHDSAVYAGAHAQVRQRSAAARAVPGTLEPALEVWCAVQSRPEPTRAILTVGKRDLSSDLGLPIAVAWSRGGAPPRALLGHDVVELNDQHLHLRLPTDSPLAVGDLVALGISHPCTTFDKWRVLFTVDERYDVTGVVRTFF